MTGRAALLDSISETISDYRAGEMPAPTPSHLDQWVQQFDPEVQLPLLREIDHVLERTYCSRETVESFLSSLLRHAPLTGPDPSSFWPSVLLLDIQTAGRSQSDMVEMFGALVVDELGVALADGGGVPSSYLYLDDGIFSGGRVLSDLSRWIRTDAPHDARVEIVSMALHLGGKWYAQERLQAVAQQAGKTVSLHWWSGVNVENRQTYTNSSDVLRPTELPNDERVLEYAAGLEFPVRLRTGSQVGRQAFFSSGDGRHLLEQELLKAGVRIRDMCPYLNEYQRPLGNWVLQTLGFGSMIVTFRNCPNNAPLALWAGDPWYPLLPRRTN
jgi:hypothetical protein